MITIAAVDSSVADKAAADVVCDGVNDQADINTALGGGNIEVFLFNGNYQIDAPIDLPPGAILRGNAEAGVVLHCNTTSGVMRSNDPDAFHQHVLVESMRVTAGTQDDLGLDLRGFSLSVFNRLRVTSFDLGVWFGGDLPTYTACWTNVFSQFYLGNNLVGFKFSGLDTNGSSTANNITLREGEIDCRDASGGIAVDVVQGQITVDACDIGYADASDGIVLRDGADSCRVVNSRFEWDDQDSGKYPVKILNGSQNHYIVGNIYTDACGRPNVYVENIDATKYIQIDAYARTGTLGNGGPAVNVGDFFRVDGVNEQVMLGDSANLTLYSDAYSTSQLAILGANGSITPKSSIQTTGLAPSGTPGAAAGSGGAVSIFGNDTNFMFRLDTGTSPTTGTLFTITWKTAKPSDHYTVVLTAASENSVAALQRIYVDQDNATGTTVDIVAIAALPAEDFFKFYVHVLQY